MEWVRLRGENWQNLLASNLIACGIKHLNIGKEKESKERHGVYCAFSRSVEVKAVKLNQLFCYVKQSEKITGQE